jgi:hypothetical protein
VALWFCNYTKYMRTLVFVWGKISHYFKICVNLYL